MNILITGGASGLGEAITRTLAANQDHKIYFTFNSSSAKAAKIVREFKNATSLRCDFKDANSLSGLLESMPDLNPDILINNALTGFAKKHFHKLKAEFLAESYQENVLPTLQITQQALKVFRKKKFGKIISILSSAIINKPPIGWSEYAANKAYLLSMSKSWAAENAAFNITANCVSPALMLTSLTGDMDERIIENYQQNHPLKEVLPTQDTAEAVAYLAGATQHINGVNLIINSGSDVV